MRDGAMSPFGTTRKCPGNFTMAAFGAEADMDGARSFFGVITGHGTGAASANNTLKPPLCAGVHRPPIISAALATGQIWSYDDAQPGIGAPWAP